MSAKPPAAILERVKLVKGKRARVVVEHILKHGSITTEDLDKYGYKHPPRAVRDVREQGVPLEMFWTRNRDGRRIGGYRFGDPAKIRQDRLGGRKVLPKKFVRKVIQRHQGKCGICLTAFEPRYFQIDHRVPYEVAADQPGTRLDPATYMPLCGSCNRAKSWSCEHCRNWSVLKKKRICRKCYWAYPASYEHVAMREIRRLDLVWQEREVGEFRAIAGRATAAKEELPDFVKDVLRKHLRAGK